MFFSPKILIYFFCGSLSVECRKFFRYLWMTQHSQMEGGGESRPPLANNILEGD